MISGTFLQAALVFILLIAEICADAVKARAYVVKANKDNNAPLQSIGVLDFTQIGGTVKINGTLRELTPGLHGFHVHDKGDIGNGCMAAGAHFNPTNKTHGGPTDIERHVGDLGNIQASESGIANLSMEDTVISLHGPFSIVGRTIVVHERVDDLGRGNTEASKTTGDSGARIACGIIGITEELDHPLIAGNDASFTVPHWLSIGAILSFIISSLIFG